MDYSDVFAGMQFAAATAIAMVGLLKLRRWWHYRAEPQTPVDVGVVLAVAILMLVVGGKQFMWMVHGMSVAAGIRAQMPSATTLAMICNLGIVLAGANVFRAAASDGRDRHILVACVLGLIGVGLALGGAI